MHFLCRMFAPLDKVAAAQPVQECGVNSFTTLLLVARGIPKLETEVRFFEEIDL